MINIKYHDHEYFERRMSCEGHLKCFKQSWSSTSTLYKRRFPKKRFQAITFDWRSTSVSYSLMLFFWDTPLGHVWSYGRWAIYGQNGHLCHNTASNKFMCVEAKFIYKFYYKQIDEEQTITISWWEIFLWWDQTPTLHCKSDSNARSWSHFKHLSIHARSQKYMFVDEKHLSWHVIPASDSTLGRAGGPHS